MCFRFPICFSVSKQERLRETTVICQISHFMTSCIIMSWTVMNSARRRHVRSAARGDLQVPATRTVTHGPRSSTACAPKLWNSLPTTLWHSTLTLTQFCSLLKTHLFGLAYGSAPWLFRMLERSIQTLYTYIHMSEISECHFTALHAMQTRSSDENSLRPSVRLSVCPSHAWIVTKR